MLKIKTIRFSLLVGVVFSLICSTASAQVWNAYHSVSSISGKYFYNKTETPDRLIEQSPASETYTPSQITFQWESSDSPVTGFADIVGATGAELTFSIPLTRTKYYKRRSTISGQGSIYSNTIKLALVSTNWEDRNYVKEYIVRTKNITTIDAVADLPIGQRIETTLYSDGMGRPLQQLAKGVAGPAEGNTTWRDLVMIKKYDAYGRDKAEYLPYSTVTEAGKYKTSSITEQATYHTNQYGESSPLTQYTYENSPLNRLINSKRPGTVWAAGTGRSMGYETNTTIENVQCFSVNYVQGQPPIHKGAYAAGALIKQVETDEKGNRTISYLNKDGNLILKKIQVDEELSETHTGWMCTYYVYDDHNLLSYTLQPEAVKYLEANSWSFAGTNGMAVLNGLCFQYSYDKEGRNIWKKVPGAAPLIMLYDSRDRVVFTQDGKQAAKAIPEWTTTLYDDLDRVTTTLLYATSKTVEQLQADIDGALTKIYEAPPATHLTYDARVLTVPRYVATGSITFLPGFTSGTNDEFIAEIETVEGAGILIDIVLKNPITPQELADPAICTIVQKNYFDNYSFAGVKTFDPAFENSSAYPATGSEVEGIAKSGRTLGELTGSSVRVLGTSTFLNFTVYYDETGRQIQVLKDNIKSGTDVSTVQYHFDGSKLSIHEKHTAANSGYTNFSILTKFVLDKVGNLISLQKKFGSNSFKTIASYEYDDMGRMKRKILDPGYSGAGKSELETLEYSYNINGNITGVNKDYALKTAGKYDKWEHFFGYYLGYDNKDDVFAGKQLDGHVAGVLWNTQGDDAQRKFDFYYDNAGRLSNATFFQKQLPGEVWTNSKLDFSTTGRNGVIEYDLNSNLLFMLQKGILPGTSAPVVIDDLKYDYAAYSSKLLKVTDNTTLGVNNGKFGDFKDGSNGTTDDYVYDENGNLVIDLNKNIKDLAGVAGANGIRYNFLDKPEEINVPGKGKITVVYDANGSKLQRTYTPSGSTTTITTSYINGYIYKGDELQFINFEEGRLRIIQPVSQTNGLDMLAIDGNLTMPGNKSGVFDYFVTDYLKNVRMILTEEQHIGSNQCTMEVNRAQAEEPLFGQDGAANELVVSRFAVSGIPGQSIGEGWQNSTIGEQVSRLGNLAGQKTGPNALLKVMAGDEINATTLYYYKSPVVNNSNGTGLATSVLTSLMSAISGSSVTNAAVKGGAGNISSNLGADLSFINHAAPDATNPAGNTPKAYLTILFFDERFNLVNEGSSSLRVTDANAMNASLTLTNLKAPKNGYVFAYVSNESDETVYFDNFQLAHKRGHIIEENHYYAYGLRIEGISSRKLGDPGYEGHLMNNNLFNDKELWDDLDLNWYDYGFRNYDPQIGRFTQLDPMADEYSMMTPYQYAGCDPIANIDIDGLEAGNAVFSALNKFVGKILHTADGFMVSHLASVEVVAIRHAAKLTGVQQFLKFAKEVGTTVVEVAGKMKDFIPFSGLVDIYEGIKNGNGMQVLEGAGSVVFDAATGFGIGTLIKGAAKVAVKASMKTLTRVVSTAASKTIATASKYVVRPTSSTILKYVGCFVQGTLIWGSAGAVPIESVKAGDKVHAYDSSAKQVVLRTVTTSYIREVNQLIKLTYKGEVLYTTSEHPFYIQDQWVEAEKLKVGDSLFLEGKYKIPLLEIKVIDTLVTVYNFTVETDHNYFVGNYKVLAHNNNPCSAGAKAGAKAVGNIAKNAKKMSPDDIGEFLGAGKNWHSSGAKNKFLKNFKKELKGDTNADFYLDKTTGDVFLKSNQSGNWINTGRKF